MYDGAPRHHAICPLMCLVLLIRAATQYAQAGEGFFEHGKYRANYSLRALGGWWEGWDKCDLRNVLAHARAFCVAAGVNSFWIICGYSRARPVFTW